MSMDFIVYSLGHLIFATSMSLMLLCLWFSYFLVAQTVKNLPAMWETQVRSLSQGDPLEKEMATHSSILAWRIPWTEKPGGLQSKGPQRVGHDWHFHFSFMILDCYRGTICFERLVQERWDIYYFCHNYSTMNIFLPKLWHALTLYQVISSVISFNFIILDMRKQVS